MSSYFTPPCNNNQRGQSHSTTSHAMPSGLPSGGGFSQSPGQTKQGGHIPPPPGARHTSGQTVMRCTRCNELLPPGAEHYVHLVGCGAAELLTNALTPYNYPPRQNHSGRR